MPRPDRHRDALLEAAGSLLRRQGYAATPTAQVLAAAGATNGSLYHHFPGGKEELARTALDAAGEQVERGLRAALAGGPELTTVLVAWVDALTAALHHHPLDGCPVAPTAVEAAALGDELRASAAGAFARWTRALAEALEPALGTEAATTRARVLLAGIEGALLLDRTAGGTEHLRALRATIPSLVDAPG